MKDKFFDVYMIGNTILLFGISMALFIGLQFSYIDNRHIPLSPLFVIPTIISIVGVIIMYVGDKYYD